MLELFKSCPFSPVVRVNQGSGDVVEFLVMAKMEDLAQESVGSGEGFYGLVCLLILQLLDKRWADLGFVILRLAI